MGTWMFIILSFFLFLSVFGHFYNKLKKDLDLSGIRLINCQCWQLIKIKCTMETKENKFSGASFSIFGLDQLPLTNAEYWLCYVGFK